MGVNNPRAQLRDEIRKILNCPSLDFFYSEELVVREKLQELVDEKLRGRTLSHSISHSNLAAGAAFVADSDGQIGFDIEETSRVSRAVALRISDEQQLAAAVSPAALFVAKEAAFKSLRGPRQPKVLSEVEIFNWSTLQFSHPLHNFTARVKGQEIQWLGVCYEDSQHTIGLSLFHHST